MCLIHFHLLKQAQQMTARLDIVNGVKRIEQPSGLSPVVIFKYKASPNLPLTLDDTEGYHFILFIMLAVAFFKRHFNIAALFFKISLYVLQKSYSHTKDFKNGS